MNKILVEKDKITNCKNQNLSIENNNITFISSGEYTIEYIECKNTKIYFNIEDNVTINLFEYSSNTSLTLNNTYNIKSSSTLNIYKFYSNKEVLENITINLNNMYSTVNYHFSNICSNIEKYHLIINHNASNTQSFINNKSITEKNADLSFTIDSVLPKGNVNCNLDQQTRIITLEDSNAKIEPNMYIEEDNVTAKHGSVIGKFSQDELFYLMTRGITYEESLKLLIKGLIFSNLSNNLEQRERILNIINQKWR